MIARVRRPYLDWVRGLAVLLMIEAHVFDSWTSAADRSGIAYRNLMILGGFAAPLFLWLAGLAGVLSAERTWRQTGDRVQAALTLGRRGIEILLLGFLFRLQAFVISPGKSPLSLLRVDILNIIGPSVVLVALVWMLFRVKSALIGAFVIFSLAIAVYAQAVRSAEWVGLLPSFLQWYIRPAGAQTTFTLFPWAGFALSGAAVGAVIAWAESSRSERLTQFAIFTIGAVLLAVGLYGAFHPPMFSGSAFWTTSPEFFILRIGVLMLALALIFGLELLIGERAAVLAPLGRLGKASLFVYWIHVEMVYGYLSWPIRRQLRLPETLLAYVLFCGLMYLAVIGRDRWLGRRTGRSSLGQAAPAGA